MSIVATVGTVIVPVILPSGNSSPGPALWMLLMMVFVLPAFMWYLFSGDVMKKNLGAAVGLVAAVGFVLMVVIIGKTPGREPTPKPQAVKQDDKARLGQFNGAAVMPERK